MQLEKANLGGVNLAISIAAFILAGIAEIGGGYLIWVWLREGRPLWVGIAGGIVLTVYGVIPTVQPSSFGRVYAAYGGVFIALSLLWAWRFDHMLPDRADLVGAGICVIGSAVIMFWPRV